MAAVDRLQHEHASRVAAEGAELARALALDAEAHAVPDDVDIADTRLEIARERDAAVVAVASHGISGLRPRVLGSVVRTLREHRDRPVLVIIVRPTGPGEISRPRQRRRMPGRHSHGDRNRDPSRRSDSKVSRSTTLALTPVA